MTVGADDGEDGDQQPQLPNKKKKKRRRAKGCKSHDDKDFCRKSAATGGEADGRDAQ